MSEVRCSCGALIRDANGKVVSSGAVITQGRQVVACGRCSNPRYVVPRDKRHADHPDYEPPREFWRPKVDT